jgi:hypothetical protein
MAEPVRVRDLLEALPGVPELAEARLLAAGRDRRRPRPGHGRKASRRAAVAVDSSMAPPPDLDEAALLARCRAAAAATALGDPVPPGV